MNLRDAEDYTIGLDLGTGSVGWAVVDDEGNPYHIKGMPTLGSRLFPSADTAADTRMKRSARRRYERRKQRVLCLQEIFAEEMSAVDPDFFVRMSMSSLVSEDKRKNVSFAADDLHALFNETDFTEADYYNRFPTIWHLRKHLMESDEKEDIRLVYLALHNIVKHRGSFLHEDEAGLTAEKADATTAGRDLADALVAYYEQLVAAGATDSLCEPDAEGIARALDKRGISTSDRVIKLQEAFCLPDAKVAKELSRACAGYKVEFSVCFHGLEKQEGTKIALNDDEKLDGLIALCPDDALPVLDCLIAAYSAYTLSSILQGSTSLSEAMIRSYERHKSDLADLKGLVKEYCGPMAYKSLFRGPKTGDGSYDINKLPKGSYTAYIAGEKLANNKGCSQADLVKNIRSVLDNADEAIYSDERYLRIKPRLESDDGEFLSKQKTRTNGVIPYQLHLEEMIRIIDRQGVYYPFLLENKDLLCKIVSSRIPYYVGPLNTSPDPNGPFPKNKMDSTRKFAWSVRKPGMEQAKAYPWNVDEVFDLDETAERFIMRMTGTCTYVYGEPVLPRCSLLYEEFCVLNELNGARWARGNSEPKRFDAADREGLVEDLFKRRKTVSYKAVSEWLKREQGELNAIVSGAQGETGFVSKLNSYNDFCQILNVSSLEDEDCPLSVEDIEQIILWNTVFEDRSILKRKLEQNYGEVLTQQQINKITKKRYTGWGRLSRAFLAEIKIDTPLGGMGIIDILRIGNPITGRHREAMNLMEILGEKRFGFQELIDERNKQHFAETGEAMTIDEMPGSPALRRSVNQAMRILDEIVAITGKPPARICLETTRDDDLEKKGQRTKTRFKNLEEALQAFKADMNEFDPQLLKDLKSKQNSLDDDRLLLYFAQCGKSLYSGKPLDIRRLSEYQIDHILPQAYIKDDSIDNRALVLQEENQRKADSLLLDNSIIDSQISWWRALNKAKLISDKKFRNLTCREISDRRLSGFINRQLVETSQVVKFVRQMCEQRYPDSEVVSVRASLSHGVREECGLPKCRELNDYHHAHDAFIACQVARFVSLRYPHWQDGFELNRIRNYVKSLGGEYAATRRIPGHSGFIVNSFMRDGFDRETGEIFKDTWDAQREIERMKSVLSYKKVFLSRMLLEQTGAFWDETVFSPRDEKHKSEALTALKGFGTEGSLDPAKYGGYDKARAAYFFIFVAKDKKGRQKCFFEGVPIHLVSAISATPDTLREYAESIAAAEGCSDVIVLRDKVPLRQKFIMDGDEFFLCGRSNKSNEIRPATEIALTPKETERLLALIESKEVLTDEEYITIYRNVSCKLKRTNGKLSQSLGLEELEDSALKIDDVDRAKLVKNILRVTKGESQGCDLTTIGRTKSVGYMRVNLASRMPNIVWCDQSVTGIFEHRTTFEDMLNGV